MNPQVPDELISAYFDGEVTPEERAAVEKLLASSEESQRELNETARLSAILHSFPRESAPDELAAQVLLRTDALPLPAAPTVSRPADQAGSIPVWPQVRAALVSAFATAAVFLLVLRVVEPGGRPSMAVSPTGAPAPGVTVATAPMASEPYASAPLAAEMSEAAGAVDSAAIRMAGRDAHDSPAIPLMAQSVEQMTKAVDGVPVPREPEAAKAELKRQAEVNLPESPQRKETRSQEFRNRLTETEGNPGGPTNAGVQGKSEMVSRNVPRLMRSTPTADAVPAPAPAPATDPGMVPPAPAMDDGGAGSLALEPEEFLNPLANDVYLDNLQQGRMYTFVPQPADPETNAGVVDLMVVDVDRAAETMQVLLGKQQVERKTDGNRGREDELVVLYANAPADRIARALNDVTQHPDLFVGWSAQLPLELAESSVPGEKQSDKLPARGEADEARQAVEAFVKRSRPAGPGSLSALAGNANSAAVPQAIQAQGDLQDSKKDQAGVEVLRLPMNDAALAYSGNRARGGNGALNQNLQSQQQRRMATAFNGPGRADVGNRNIRMLFVLHPSPAEAMPGKDRK